MEGIEVRLYGDPLTGDAAAAQLCALLRQIDPVRIHANLCMTAARGLGEGRALQLSDGRREFELFTQRSEADLALLRRAIATEVAATAPLLVFGGELLQLQAALEFPRACLVLDGRDPRSLAQIEQAWPQLLDRDQGSGLPLSEWRQLAELPQFAPGSGLRCLHLADPDGGAGTEVLLKAWPDLAAARPGSSLQVYGSAAAEPSERLDLPGVLWLRGRPGLEALALAQVVVQPYRRSDGDDLRFCQQILAAGRLLIAPLIEGLESCVDGYRILGGRRVGTELLADPVHLRTLLMEAGEAGADCLAITRRGRQLIRREAVQPRCRAAQPRQRSPRQASCRPLVVLEAPLFETSSSSVLTLATAQALRRRDEVDLRLVPRRPFGGSLEDFARAHPELCPLLSRGPGDADLWLSAGWPLRRGRPPARCHALRFDWEYGSLPSGLAPALTQDADQVVVHSKAGLRMLAAAGRPLESIHCIPHGVDGELFRPQGPRLARVVDFAKGRRVLLFVGGLIWRKGFDLVARMLTDLAGRGDEVCLVVKPVGSQGSYLGHNLSGLVDRLGQHSAVPEILVLDEDFSPAQMAALYRSANLLLHPYRGEGFGMPVLEARASGLPVLVTAGGSTDDFCAAPGCIQVPAERRTIELPGAHLGPPWVLEPEPEAMAEAVRRFLQRLEPLQEAAQREAASVASRWSWDTAAATLEGLAWTAWGAGRARDLVRPPAVYSS